MYVVIDDYFPVGRGGKSCFVKGGADGNELWPTVLEKAYAKMYGTYSMIEGGLTHLALADLMNGYPEMVETKEIRMNAMSQFWSKIQKASAAKALMGAGTPPHELGDKATNGMGIV